jgi:hypothetical protein
MLEDSSRANLEEVVSPLVSEHVLFLLIISRGSQDAARHPEAEGRGIQSRSLHGMRIRTRVWNRDSWRYLGFVFHIVEQGRVPTEIASFVKEHSDSLEVDREHAIRI